MEVNPIEPQRLQELVERAYSLPPRMIERITALQQPPETMARVEYKKIQAKIVKLEKGRADIDVVGGGRETIRIRPGDTKVSVAGAAAEASAITAGMTCAIAYLGDKTTAATVACE